MSTFSDILIDIEDLWSQGKSFDEIAKTINKQYNVYFTEAEVDAAVSQILDKQDQAYNDDMDGDHASALASAGFGTDEDYGYYGE